MPETITDDKGRAWQLVAKGGDRGIRAHAEDFADSTAAIGDFLNFPITPGGDGPLGNLSYRRIR